MAAKYNPDDLKGLTTTEINDYLYKTGLANVFDNYNAQVENLKRQQKMNIEDAYSLNEISKRYLGEYASNIGLGDISGSLQSIANDYLANLSNIKSQTESDINTLTSSLESSKADLFSSYAKSLFEQQQLKEQNEAAARQSVIADAMQSGFYGYKTDESGNIVYDKNGYPVSLTFDEFLNSNIFQDTSDIYKDRLKQENARSEYLNNLARLDVSPDLLPFGTDLSSLNTNVKMLGDNAYYIGGATNQLRISKDKTTTFTDSAGNVYATIDKSINEMDTNTNKKGELINDAVKKALNIKELPTGATLNTLYKSQNSDALPTAGSTVLYEDSTTGTITMWYYKQNKGWTLAYNIGNKQDIPQQKSVSNTKSSQITDTTFNDWARSITSSMNNH